MKLFAEIHRFDADEVEAIMSFDESTPELLEAVSTSIREDKMSGVVHVELNDSKVCILSDISYNMIHGQFLETIKHGNDFGSLDVEQMDDDNIKLVATFDMTPEAFIKHVKDDRPIRP